MFTCNSAQIECLALRESVRVYMLEVRAREMGEDHGRAAASWYFDGNTSTETYRTVLRGIDDGDPMILATFPSAPLSGEWSDSPTPASVLADLGFDSEDDSEDYDRVSDILNAYEDGFYTASTDAIERVARYQVS